MKTTFSESFDDGPGGWVECFKNGRAGIRAHERQNGALISRSPWWIDYNHAPPGGGYLHLLFCLHTFAGRFYSPEVRAAGGTNRFIEGGFPTDLTAAKITFKVCGELELSGAECLLLVQANLPSSPSGVTRCVPFLLTGQPIAITPEYSQQTVTISPDASQWKCMGSRHDRGETYGWSRIEDALRDVNCNIMLVLHPLEIVPLEPSAADPHLLRAGEEYSVDRALLPQGFIALDEVRIEFSH